MDSRYVPPPMTRVIRTRVAPAGIALALRGEPGTCTAGGTIRSSAVTTAGMTSLAVPCSSAQGLASSPDVTPGEAHIRALPPVHFHDGVTDAQLVARILAGDHAAFEILARRHFRAMSAIAQAYMRDSDEAEDVCQEALVRAWHRLAQCRDPERFAAWLLRIVRNQAIKRRAWLAVRRAAGLEQAETRPSKDSPEASLRRSEIRSRLTAALDGIRPRQREVVLLFDLEGYSHAEIADRLGISEMMSRRHLSDARAALRRILGNDTGGSLRT
jgi:RNA polymerase sigma-70 factor, ECF subfamily